MSALARVAIRDVIDVVCQRFGVTYTDLRSARRTNDIVLPRHWVSWLAVKLTEKSLPQIGQAICRDHSSVIYGRDRIDRLVGFGGDTAILAMELQAAVLAIARLRGPGGAFEVVEEDELETPHDIARRIMKGGRRAAMNASVEDVIGLCQAVLATPEPLLITDAEIEQEPAHG